MYYFLNDYSELAHPSIFEAMKKANLVPDEGYFEDSHTKKAKEYIKKNLGNAEDVEIYMMTGGTLTNLISISSFLRPYQAVISAFDSHINIHETGAVEAVGHKILTVKTPDGKINPAQIQNILDENFGIHMVEPAMVVISNSTELGSIYSKLELIELYNYCQKKGLLLYCDGARLGSALTSVYNDLTLEDMKNYTDAFYIGGTKNGALIGEALVVNNPSLNKGFKHMAKQKGGLLAKGKLVGIQFEELFRENLFFDLATHANEMSLKINRALVSKGYCTLCKSQSNQIFPYLKYK